MGWTFGIALSPPWVLRVLTVQGC